MIGNRGGKWYRAVPWSALIAGGGVIATGSWLADGVKGEALFADWCPALQRPVAPWAASACAAIVQHRLVVVLVVLVLFAASVLWLYAVRSRWLTPRTLSRSEAAPHRALILLPSTPTHEPEFVNGAGSFAIVRDLKLCREVQLSGDLAHDIKAITEAGLRWNWQQILRGLLPHGGVLQCVYLIGSPTELTESGERRGSFEYLGTLRRMLARYVPNAQILQGDQPVDFEDFDALVQAIAHGLDALRSRQLKERDVVIDVTGGPKTTSIAGAITTLHNGVTFQYVQTDREDPKIWAYDVRILMGGEA